MSDSPGTCPENDVLESLALGADVPAAAAAHVRDCPHCRAALRRIEADNCLLREYAPQDAPWALPAEDRGGTLEIPGYAVGREIHRGGQGVVYHAVQRSTKREVAIKVMREGPFATLGDRVRFEREVETLARLEHPNIVAVHDAGVAAGVHYFVMNYVDGRPLHEALAQLDAPLEKAPAGQRRGLAPRVAEILRVFVQVCDAVHAAHLRGVIHRDLKPRNILLDRNRTPHVLDFGLAKPLDASGAPTMTRTGQFVGSLPWAAPEQVEGIPARVDLRTDVYALGAILFQLLTNSLPIDVGSNLHDALEGILKREPRRPSQVSAAVGGDALDDELDTIVLKCLSKDRERRYQSAAALADDLRNYLSGRPISAKSDSTFYVFRKTLHRHQLPVAVGIGFVLLLLAFGILMTWLYRRSTVAEHGAQQAAQSLRTSLAQSNVAQGRMAALLGNIHEAERLLWDELLALEPAEARLAGGAPVRSEAYWALWELYRRHPCALAVPYPAAPLVPVTARGAAGIWVCDPRGAIERIDERGVRLESRAAPRWEPRGLCTVDPLASLLFRYDRERFSVTNVESGRMIFDAALTSAPQYGMHGVAADGGSIAVIVDRGVSVFSRDGTPRRRFQAEAELLCVALNADGTRVAARDRTGLVHVFRVEDGSALATLGASEIRTNLRGHGPLAFSDDGQLIADAWMESPGRIWNLATPQSPAVPLAEPSADYRVLAFSPDARLLAVGDAGGTLRIFDTRGGQRRGLHVADATRVYGVAFSGDGRRVWTGGSNGLRLWEVDEDAGMRVHSCASDTLHGVAFTPDGRRIIAGGAQGTLYQTSPTEGPAQPLSLERRGIISAVDVSPRGDLIAASTYANSVVVLEIAAGNRVLHSLAHPRLVSHVAFSPDGARVATACDDAVVRVWSAANGSTEREFREPRDRIPQVAFDPAGKRLAAAVRDGSLLVWRLEDGNCTPWAAPTNRPLRALRFSPDGARLVAGGADRRVEVFDAAGDGRRLDALVGHNQEIYCLDVAADSDLVASGDAGGTIRLWSIELGRALATLEGHSAAVMGLRFSPDGQTLASVSLDGTLRVWDFRYYARHVAGNAEAQLQRTRLDAESPQRASAWRTWLTEIR